MSERQYCLRHAAGLDYLIKTNQQEENYVPPFLLNECGAMIWSGLEAGLLEDELSKMMEQKYGISAKEASADVSDFIRQLENRGFK